MAAIKMQDLDGGWGEGWGGMLKSAPRQTAHRVPSITAIPVARGVVISERVLKLEPSALS